MSVMLEIICENNFGFDFSEEFAKATIEKIKKLKLILSMKYDGTFHKYQKWGYQLNYFEEDNEATQSIQIMGNAIFYFKIYKNAIVIGSHYRYWIIFDKDDIEWFDSFRKEVYKIITFFGATEIIYLPDNYDHLCIFYNDIEDGESYNDVKQKMLLEYGEPVTDYAKLNTKRNRKGNLKQYFIDDFSDLKNINKLKNRK